MIAYINGRIISKASNSVIIENNGIGYEIIIPLSTLYNLPEDHEDVSLYIHPYIKDETMTLFGFFSMLEKRLFLMLISISGIGPKLAINILSGIGPEDLLNAIANEDVTHLCRIPGIGKKTAQRLILELKEKAGKIVISEGIRQQKGTEDPIVKDVLSALLNLGYPEDMAKEAIKKAMMRIKDRGLESLIRESLRIMA